MTQHGKKYKDSLTKVDREQLYGLSEAVDILKDLNTNDLEAAKKQVAGTARSMGIKVAG